MANVNIKEAMSQGLLRQRRNIIITSLTLIFSKYSDLQISKFSILGIQFDSLGNPESVYTAMWLVWFYFLVRYSQYFIQEGLPSFAHIFRDRLDEACSLKIYRIVEKKYPNNIINEVNYTMLKQWGWIFSGQSKLGDDGMGGLKVENFKLSIPQNVFYINFITSFLYVSTLRSAFTDHIFPMLLALFALLYCSQNWSGGLVGVIARIIT